MNSKDISHAINLIRSLSGRDVEDQIEDAFKAEKDALGRPALDAEISTVAASDDEALNADPFDISELDIPDDIEIDPPAINVDATTATTADSSGIAVAAVPSPVASTASPDITISSLEPEASIDDELDDDASLETAADNNELVWNDSIHFLNAVRALISTMTEVLYDVESYIGTVPNFEEFSFNGEYFIKGITAAGLNVLLKYTDLDNNAILVDVTLDGSQAIVNGVKPE